MLVTNKKGLKKNVVIELWFTDEYYEELIDTTIKVNEEFHSHYHLNNLEELTEIIKEIQDEE
jgi:hypothetical protein